MFYSKKDGDGIEKLHVILLERDEAEKLIDEKLDLIGFDTKDHRKTQKAVAFLYGLQAVWEKGLIGALALLGTAVFGALIYLLSEGARASIKTLLGP